MGGRGAYIKKGVVKGNRFDKMDKQVKRKDKEFKKSTK